MDTLLENLLNTVQSVQRILYLSALKHHFDDKVKITGPHLTQIITSSVTWAAITRELQAVIVKDFEVMRQYSKLFRNYFPTFDYSRQYSSEAFANQDHIANSKSIRQEMMQLKRWQDELDRMKISNCCGVFQVDSKIMKNELIRAKDEVLDDMKKILASAARESCDKVLAEFVQKQTVLSTNPTSLKDFATFIENKSEIFEQTKLLMQKKQTVDDMYKLLQSQFDVKIHLTAQGKWEDLHKTSLGFSEYLENAEGVVSQRMSQMTQTVKGQISTLDEEAMSICNSLMSGLVVDDMADSIDVLDELADKKKDLDKMDHEKEVLAKTHAYVPMFIGLVCR